MAGQRGEERESAYQAIRGMIADAAGVSAATTEGGGATDDLRIYGQDGDVPGHAGRADGGHGVAEGGREDGWELVSSVPSSLQPGRDRYGTVGCQMILKRSSRPSERKDQNVFYP